MYRPQLLKRLTVLTNTKVKAFDGSNIELAGALLNRVESRQGWAGYIRSILTVLGVRSGLAS